MLQTDQKRFSPTVVELKDGRKVTLGFLALEDAGKLGDFYASLPRSTYRFYSPHPLTRESAAKETAKALLPAFVALVAKDDDQEIVGYAWYQWEDDDSRASTFGICLRQACRGIGLGQAMMERLLEIAGRIGPPVMSLTVQKANSRALALYRKMGFQVVREQMRGQVEELAPEPEYLMERHMQ